MKHQNDQASDQHPACKTLQGFSKPAAIGLLHDPGFEDKHEVGVGPKVERRDNHGGQPGNQQRTAHAHPVWHGLTPKQKAGHDIAGKAQGEPHERNDQRHIAQLQAEHVGVGVTAKEPAARRAHLFGKPAQQQGKDGKQTGLPSTQKALRCPEGCGEHDQRSRVERHGHDREFNGGVDGQPQPGQSEQCPLQGNLPLCVGHIRCGLSHWLSASYLMRVGNTTLPGGHPFKDGSSMGLAPSALTGARKVRLILRMPRMSA